MKKVILTVLAVATLTSCNQSKNETQKQMEKQTANLVELTTFKLNKEVTSDDFVKSASQMQTDFLQHQKGFIKRTLTVSGDTLWTDIVYWENQESHEKAMKIAEKSEKVMPFMTKIDFNSVKMNLSKPMFTNE